MFKNVVLVALLSVSSWGWLSCSQEHPEVKEPLRPVRYVQVFSTGGSRVRTFSGVAKSGVESNLSFKVSGTVEQVLVKVGDKVRRGQLLAKLDAQDFRLKVQQAQAGLSQARALKQKAQADYERIRGLYENNNAAKSDLDAARAAFESATASVEAAEKQLELAQLQLSYTHLTAPVEGSIATVDIDVNENVAAGRPVMMLTAGSEIDVEVAMPEVLIAQIRRGDKVVVKLDALPDRTFNGVVTEVGVAATQYATTFPVTVRVQDAGSEIRSGMAAEVAFTFETTDEKERILVPPVAVGEDRQGRFAYVVRPVSGDTAVVHRVAVQIGELTRDGLEVISGLSDGDLVVTAGVSKLSDGQKVKM